MTYLKATGVMENWSGRHHTGCIRTSPLFFLRKQTGNRHRAGLLAWLCL